MLPPGLNGVKRKIKKEKMSKRKRKEKEKKERYFLGGGWAFAALRNNQRRVARGWFRERKKKIVFEIFTASKRNGIGAILHH